MECFVQLVKLDEERRLVHGRAVQEVPDRSQEILDYDSAKPAFQEWSRACEEASGGRSKGNVRAMHGSSVAGKVVDLAFNDAEKAIDIVVKVVDDNEWRKCAEGCYTGFSVGGSYARKWQDGPYTRYTPKVAEVSLVDRPSIPTATFFTIHKADGSVEERIFAHDKGEAPVSVTTASKRMGREAVTDPKPLPFWDIYRNEYDRPPMFDECFASKTPEGLHGTTGTSEAILQKREWDESQCTRDEEGKFASKGTLATACKAPDQAGHTYDGFFSQDFTEGLAAVLHFSLSLAPGSGEVISFNESRETALRAWKDLMAGNYTQAAGNYAVSLAAAIGTIPIAHEAVLAARGLSRVTAKGLDALDAPRPRGRQELAESGGILSIIRSGEHGPFGPIFKPEPGEPWRDLVDFLWKERTGEIEGALHHEQVGSISLPWGFSRTKKSPQGAGLAKIIIKHPEVMYDIPYIFPKLRDIISEAERKSLTTQSRNEIILEDEIYRGYVRLDYDRVPKIWLNSAYQKGLSPKK